MSIQQLPENVIAYIKSSTTITSLNGVVCGLVKNSLDAAATKITISVDYVRGNCSVEDNGLGIPPNEFKPAGGLGKLHHTSKFPTRNDTHGRHGAFLASVAALSLLSITSHHHAYNSHNSIKIHNSEIIARHIPSLPEQRLLSFPHGTRTTVRDLFGSMPVRVKQRAIEAERNANTKDWEWLKRALVALLLAWPGQVSISLRDSVAQRNFAIRIPEDSSNSQGQKHVALSLTTRVSRTLFQAQLSDDRSRDLWVPLKASAGSVSVVGAVSLVPTASRQIQFISIGVRPVPNEHGSNVLYEEVNRLFVNSSFGVEEDGGGPREDDQNRRSNDRRFKTDGFTNQELRGRKGVDRWPMFYIKIMLGGQVSQLTQYDVEEILDERRESLKAVVDVLSAVVYEFLKAHHFRPRYSRSRKIASSRDESSRDTRSRTVSRSSTPKVDTQTSRPRASRNQSSVGDLASTRLKLTPNASRQRPGSPFDSWTRVKSGQPQYAHLHDKLSDQESHIGCARSQDQSVTATRSLENNDNVSETPLVAADGTLLRIPFLDVEMDPFRISQKDTPEEGSIDEGQTRIRGGEEVLWTNPTTKETLVIDTRTGLVIRPSRNEIGALDPYDHAHHPPLRKKLRTNAKPAISDERSKWLEDLLSSWDNPVFGLQEPPIPVAFNEEKVLALPTNTTEGCCLGHKFRPLESIQAASHSSEGRLSKDSLRNATVVAQVDRKFILIKVPLPSLPSALSTNKGKEASLLTIIDQHAADERCRVEALMRDYFITAKDAKSATSEDSRVLVRAQAELLEEPIVFDVSPRDSHRFQLSAEYFEHWGIVFQVISMPKPKHNDRGKAILKVVKLPPSIAERCRSEPRLLIELLRKEAWKLDANGHKLIQTNDDKSVGLHWLARFHGCPDGIMEMINSRACRSSIMFNDHLSHEACVDLVKRLADCALPFQCAHGRPSMVPLVDTGNIPMKGPDVGRHADSFGTALKRWRSTMGDS